MQTAAVVILKLTSKSRNCLVQAGEGSVKVLEVECVGVAEDELQEVSQRNDLTRARKHQRQMKTMRAWKAMRVIRMKVSMTMRAQRKALIVKISINHLPSSPRSSFVRLASKAMNRSAVKASKPSTSLSQSNDKKPAKT